MDIETAIVAALQLAEGEGFEVPDPFPRPDGKLGLTYKGKEYVVMIEEVRARAS
jgi:hypothetical protein